ncbi:MAG: molybdenum cofactor guanylyltransferase MobA [Pararhodobacter sp.]|nr:molybdenum cofactor guanylyltransferase MobA [Pararhodobacter sp.]
MELYAEYAPQVRIALPESESGPEPGPDTGGTAIRVASLPAILAARARLRRTRPLGVILAGGRATRMGGGDKALRPLGGRQVIDHVIDRLRPQVGTLVINANGDPERLKPLGLPVIPDTLPDRPGPLAGVLAGLDHAATLGLDFVLTAAADSPFLPDDLLDRLQTAASASGLALAASPDTLGTVRLHPTFGLWPVVLRDSLRRALNDGRNRMTDWAKAHDARMALFDAQPHDPFLNINTPDDLLRAEAILRGS